MSEDIGELLEACPAFNGMTPENLAQFASIAEVVNVPDGEAVIRKGDPGDAFYVIADGEATVLVDDDEADAMMLSAGDFFGEMAIIWNQPRTATVMAEDDLVLVKFPREPLIALLRANRELVGVLREVGLLRAEENIERFLLEGA